MIEATDAPPLPLSTLTARVLAREPGKRVLAVALDADHPGRVTVNLAGPGIRTLAGATPVLLNAHDGAVLSRPDPRTTPLGILLRLHANWFLGVPGQLAGGVVALLVAICLISGAVIYGPFIRGLLFGTIRRGRGEAVRQRERLRGPTSISRASGVTKGGCACQGSGRLGAGIRRSTSEHRMEKADGLLQTPTRPPDAVSWRMTARGGRCTMLDTGDQRPPFSDV